MFRLIQKTNKHSALFVDSTNAEELRAQRVWRFIIVISLTWLFFTCFLWFRGYQEAAWVCFADSLFHLVILLA